MPLTSTHSPSLVSTPDHSSLDRLCELLAADARRLDDGETWPAEALRLCGEYGVYRWFLPERWDGLAWSEADLVRGYLRLSGASLLVAFILTQRSGACSRILASDNLAVQQRWLRPLAAGSAFATVGISHLTTSRRHLAQPVLTARQDGPDFILDGYSPWVTGAPEADVIVLGATLADGRQILAAVETDLPGITTPQPPRLVGLSASMTGEVRLSGVRVPGGCLLAGPMENVMSAGKGAGTGGLQTSTLAVGLSTAAIEFSRVGIAEAARPGGTGRRITSRGPDAYRQSAGPLRGRAGLHQRRPADESQQSGAAGHAIGARAPPKDRATSSAIRPAAGAAKRCSFSSGAVRKRS